ncbi:P2Y purinoceptor 2-like [Pleurodeles waltl]|uniref:P2Y purinoceptor 2-like n=1 Tax=Pleurodeles waltl TaxID=8319 RepID=UPI003709BC7A
MLNASNNNTGCQPQKMHLFIPCLLGVSFALGFVLNAISLWIFWFRIKRWNSTTVLQFNLAISDAIVTPAAALILIYSVTDDWTYGTFLCQLTVFLLSTNMYGSVYFLTLISLHRYFSVVHNVKGALLTQISFIKKICLIVWGCLVLQGIPFFFLLKTSKIQGTTKCLNIHQSEMALLYFVWNTVFLVSGLIAPFGIIIICYVLLSRFILKMNPLNAMSKTMKSKSIHTISMSLAIFIICYVPLHITRTIAVTVKLFFPMYCRLLETVEIMYYITWMLTGTNCSLDPILYCFASERFYYLFRDSFTFFSCQAKICSNGTEAPTQSEDAVSGVTRESHLNPITTGIIALELASLPSPVAHIPSKN